MPNEPNPDEIHDLWRSQPAEPVRLSTDELRRRSLARERCMRRAFWVCFALSCFSAALCAWFFYAIPRTVARIGFVLTFAGEVFFVFQFLKLRRSANGQTGPTAAAYRDQLARQRDLTLNAWKNFLLPFVPGPALVLLGFLVPELGPVPAVLLVSAYLAIPFAMVIPLARRKALRMEREIAELDAQMR